MRECLKSGRREERRASRLRRWYAALPIYAMTPRLWNVARTHVRAKNRAAIVLLGMIAMGACRTEGQEPAPRPKYGPAAVRLYHAQTYVREQPARDYWALTPYYLGQSNDHSCSVASLAMLVNAFRADRELAAADELITPAALLDAVDHRLWKDKVGPNGVGVTLEELADLTKRTLAAYRLGPARVRLMRFPAHDDEAKVRLQQLLAKNERTSRDLVLVNYLQSAATGDPEGAVGHIAPLGAYDAANGRVLIFDPDRRWYEPYWISEATLLAAMATHDPVSGRSRGLLHVAVGVEATNAGPRNNANLP